MLIKKRGTPIKTIGSPTKTIGEHIKIEWASIQNKDDAYQIDRPALLIVWRGSP